MTTPRGPVDGAITTWVVGAGSVKINHTRGIIETIISINETPIDEERVDIRFGYMQRRTDDPHLQRVLDSRGPPARLANPFQKQTRRATDIEYMTALHQRLDEIPVPGGSPATSWHLRKVCLYVLFPIQTRQQLGVRSRCSKAVPTLFATQHRTRSTM